MCRGIAEWPPFAPNFTRLIHPTVRKLCPKREPQTLVEGAVREHCPMLLAENIGRELCPETLVGNAAR